MGENRNVLLWPTIALLVTQVVHGATPIDENNTNPEGYTGLVVGGILLLLTVAALLGIGQRRSYGPKLAAWTGLVVALGFTLYHASPWVSPVTNPYLGKAVGAPAWISVGFAVAAGLWCAYAGRDLIAPKSTNRPTANT